MKLNSEIKSNLQLLDYEYGGGIVTEAAKVDMIDKPVLIIGLGGTGIESLIRVKKSINRYFKTQTGTDGRKADKPANVEYLAIDSDDSMHNLKYNGISFNKENKEFLLLDSTNLTAIYKNRDSVFKELTKDWISDNLRLQQVKHGAGSIRQAGRFLLFININNVITAISEKINRLVLNRKANDMIYVFVVAGISGGTGSGTFIDIPYIVRHIAEQKGFETENIAMIFLPDVTLSDTAIDGAAALNIKTNGFAGLKELDYLMNIERNGEEFEQRYSDISVKTKQPPYDLCHLISSKDEEGKTVSAAKDYCMNVAAETIINFIASEEVLDGQNYTINSYMSNIENNKSTFLTTHSKKQPTNYIYNIVGASSGSLPVDYLTNYLTYKVFNGLTGLMTKEPTADSVYELMQAFKIDLMSVEQEIEMDKPNPRELKYDYSILIQRPDIAEEALKAELARYKEHLKLKSDKIIESLKLELANKDNIMMQHFTDLELGPYYVNRMLSPLCENSILKEIDSIRKKELNRKREPKEQLINLEVRKQSAAEKLKNSVLFKKSAAENALNTTKAYYKALTKNETYAAIDKIYDTAYKLLSGYQYNFIDTYCELLTGLKELFDKYKEPGTGTYDDKFVWNLATASEFCLGIDAEIEFNGKEILKKYLKEITLDTDSIADDLNRFMTRELQSFIEKSMDYYFEILAKNQSVSINQYIGEKIEQLCVAAKVMFPVNHMPTGLNIEFPFYSYLSIPFNAPNIRNKLRQDTGKYHVKYSKMLNRLYMLNLKIAVPLYCYKELNDYETVYEASQGKIAGLHLFEGQKKNWRNLPSPNYDKLWVSGYENLREQQRNNEIRQIFEKALEYGYIRLDEQLGKYKCRYGDNSDIYKKFKFSKDDVINKTIPATKARSLISELNNYLSSPTRLKCEKYIYDMEFISQNIPDDEYAKGIFIYMPSLNQKMADQVAQHEEILNILNLLAKIEQEEVKYSNFAQLLYMRKIYQSRKTYRYMINEEERILYTLENLQEKYVDYELFQSFLELDPNEAQYLRQTAEDKENAYSDEEFKEVLAVIDSIIKNYKEKQKSLQKTYMEEREGSLKLIFYTTMLSVLNKIKKLTK